MSDILFKKELEELENIGKEERITLLFLSTNLEDQKIYISAIINNEKIPEIMERYSWDTQLGDGKPGFIFSGDSAKYSGLGDNGIDYLVYYRTWSGKKDRIFDISQEFILYYDLYKQDSSYIKIHDDGEEEIIIKVTDNKVEFKLKYIKEFLAIKNKKLVIYFDFVRYSKETKEDFFNKEFKNENIFYKWTLGNSKFGENKIYSLLSGKKVISGKENFKPVLFEEKEYESFYVGADRDGEDIFFSSDPEKLANYFGKNPDAPNFLTPIFFKKDVLSKYFTNPDKYTVSDSTVSMTGFWSLHIDNNLGDKISVFLGYLGQLLPFNEQKYWKSFEIKEKGKISHTCYKRSIEGEFCDPEAPDLFFKNKYVSFNKKWYEKFGWKFFKDFNEKDNHLLKCLHGLSSSDNQKEFDEQILYLAKIFIDYLNEKEIYKLVVPYLKESDDKGIKKLNKFLITKGFNNIKLIKFFSNLQLLRSKGSAHKKNSEEYKKALANFSEGKQNLKEIFDEILIMSVISLNTLENRFLK